MRSPSVYLTSHAEPFEAFPRCGYTCIKVLPFLNGKPWDEVALGYVHALRPSYIRVTSDGITLDSRKWRVTVWTNKRGLIKSIEQEVEIGLPKGVAHGQALEHALKWGIDSEQVKWHLDCTGVTVVSESAAPFFGLKKGGCFKTTEDGRSVPFPEPKTRRKRK